MMPRPRQRRVKIVPMTVCRQKRLGLRMTQQKLAELAGIPQPYISKIELRHNDVTGTDLALVARVLGVEDPAELTEEIKI